MEFLGRSPGPLLRLILVLGVFLAPGAGGAGPQASPAPVRYHLEVSFDLPRNRILGVATIHGAPGRKLTLHLGDLQVKSIRGLDRKLDVTRLPDPLELAPPSGTVEIVYEGTFRDPGENIIEEQEIILRNIWYPLVEGICRYSLTATLPKEYQAISEANHIVRTEKDQQAVYTFDFPFPLNDIDGLTFAASRRYVISRGTYRDVEISTYFFPEDAHLAATYLEATGRYLKMFEDRLGRYPYRRLAIVESVHPGGFSMPTYVLLSQTEIQESSRVGMERTNLGHEIVHQWFGNSVFTDHLRGNWNEGAAIYFADHFACEQKGSDWRCRRRILSGFASHVTAQNEFPLHLFSEWTDFSSRAIGYGKAAMVFHMLRRLLGEESFRAAIRDFVHKNTFRVASWEDLQKSMEKQAGKSLAWFFRQWLDRTGLPELRLEGVTVKPLGKKSEVSFTLVQTGQVFRLSVPLTFYFREGAQKQRVSLTKAKERFTFVVNARPEELVLDEDFDLFRRLTGAENPPTFERLLTGENVAVLPPDGGEVYRRLLDLFRQEGVAMTPAGSPEAAGADGKASLIFFGRDHFGLPDLLGNPDLAAEGFQVVIRKDPRQPARLVAVIHCSPGEEVEAAFAHLLRHPFYSDYLYRRGERVRRSLEETERGIRVRLGSGSG